MIKVKLNLIGEQEEQDQFNTWHGERTDPKREFSNMWAMSTHFQEISKKFPKLAFHCEFKLIGDIQEVNPIISGYERVKDGQILMRTCYFANGRVIEYERE